MRIGINLLYLLPGLTGGTRTYGLSLVDSLLEIDQMNEYVVFLSKASRHVHLPEAANLRRVVIPFDAHNRPLRYFREQLSLPAMARKLRIDVLHSLGYVAPLRAPCPSIVSILDLNYIALQDFMPFVRRTVLRFFVQASARNADHVLTISKFSEDQIIKHLQIPGERITVTHLAPRRMGAHNDDASWCEIRARYGIRRRYVAAFSSLSRHKNLSRLAEAVAQVNVRERCDLLLIGNYPRGVLASLKAQGWDRYIVATGHVPDEHVMPLLRHSELLAFPSWYEGFGLPVLEAQQAGTVVVCSNAASLPEVAGDGAIFFDPFSTPDMVSALTKCLQDRRLRERLIQLGKENVKRFSWRTTAKDTLNVYSSVFQQQILAGV